jgi:hypothetical protein
MICDHYKNSHCLYDFVGLKYFLLTIRLAVPTTERNFAPIGNRNQFLNRENPRSFGAGTPNIRKVRIRPQIAPRFFTNPS